MSVLAESISVINIYIILALALALVLTLVIVATFRSFVCFLLQMISSITTKLHSLSLYFEKFCNYFVFFLLCNLSALVHHHSCA